MNPILKQLGFAEGDRVAIVHADDFGMCQATIPAVAELLDFGLVTSTAAMVPCPWFLAAAEVCRANPTFDVGVHTTLTSEWSNYRWGPLSTRERASGLLDAEGQFPHGCAELWAQAGPAAVAAELAAQVDLALASGVDVTHIDSHMGAVFDARLVAGYLELAAARGVPAMLPRMTASGLRERGLDEPQSAAFLERQAELEARGLPLIDAITGMPLDRHEDRLADARRIFAGLPAGLSYVILHPSADTAELRAIAPDWRARVGDYLTFLSPELRDYLREIGIQTVGWRPIRDALRQASR